MEWEAGLEPGNVADPPGSVVGAEQPLAACITLALDHLQRHNRTGYIHWSCFSPTQGKGNNFSFPVVAAQNMHSPEQATYMF